MNVSYRISQCFEFVAVAMLLVALQASAAQPEALQPFLKAQCIECHDADMQKGGLDLTALDFRDDTALHARWVQVYDRVASGEMPPAKKARPPASQQHDFLAALNTSLLKQHQAMKGTVLRRLNRIEYQNTLNDAFGLHLDLVKMLPEDSLQHGFDNQGEALGMSDVQLWRYMDAAEKALDAASNHEVRPVTKTEHFAYTDPLFSRFWSGKDANGQWLKRDDGSVVFFNGGYPNTTLKPFKAWGDGNYRVKIVGRGYQTDKPVLFAIDVGSSLNGGDRMTEVLTQGYYELPADKYASVEFIHEFARGESLRITAHGLGAKAGSPGLSKTVGGIANYTGSGLAIKEVEIEGPLLTEWPPRGHTLLFGDLPIKAKALGAPPAKVAKRAKPPATTEVVSANPEVDAQRLLRGFTTRLFRRPVSDEKLAPYVTLFGTEMKNGSTFEEALRAAATAALCSTDFLYFHETPGRLDDYALASRLSYFLWRTLPDDELLKLAVAGTLKQPAILRAQTERLLADSRAQRFVTDFTDGWLDLRNIEFTTPDKQLYPEYDDQLQDSILKETRAFFTELVAQNLPVSTIIKSDFAMLNARLAKHYGIPGVTNLDVKKTPLPAGSKRGGILTQASILKVSANGTNTSPVIRGVWVEDRILGFKPPPPPPGVPGVEPDIRGATTVRETLAKHRTLESCNACHRVIDPPGFALESYDVIGGWRDKFRSLGEGVVVNIETDGRRVRYKLAKPVDASGELVSGEKFSGFDEFQSVLMRSQDRVAACLTDRLLTFASGREMGYSDRADVARIVEALKAKKGGVRDLLHLVIQSDIFLSK